jgi:hypothetical protein
MPTPSKKSPAKKRGAERAAAQAATDPASNEALLARPKEYAAAPDMPVEVAIREIASLARLAKTQHARLAKLGITTDAVDELAHYGRRLEALEAAWQRARGGVRLSAAERKLLAEAEALDSKLVEGGRWACRKDPQALAELSRIAEGSGLADTIQDLRDLAAFWTARAGERTQTDITEKDLRRAVELADRLDEAAAKESADVDAALAIELRNRCFWAADELAVDVRQGGRYAFRDQPKLAAKFVSRYRAEVNRRSRRNAKKLPAQAPANGVSPA